MQRRLPQGSWSGVRQGRQALPGAPRGRGSSCKYCPPALQNSSALQALPALLPSHSSCVPPLCRKSQFRSSRSFFRTHRSFSLAAWSSGDSWILGEDEHESGGGRITERPRAERGSETFSTWNRHESHKVRSNTLERVVCWNLAEGQTGLRAGLRGPPVAASSPALPSWGRGRRRVLKAQVGGRLCGGQKAWAAEPVALATLTGGHQAWPG